MKKNIRANFSVHMLSYLYGVPYSTVVEWCEGGGLQNRRRPSGRRVILREHLYSFNKEKHRKPVKKLDSPMEFNIMWLGGYGVTDEVSPLLDLSFKFVIPSGSLDDQAVNSAPHCVVARIDQQNVDDTLNQVAAMRSHSWFSETAIIGVVAPEIYQAGFDLTAFDEVFRTPFELELFAARIRQLVALEEVEDLVLA